MNAETLEKAQGLQRQISDYETELRELENGCGIFVDKQGKVSIKTEREWTSKTAPDWFAQKINEALWEYRSTIVSARENLKIQLEKSMKFINVRGPWYVNTDQYAQLGYDESLEGQYKINIARIDYIENDICDGEPIYYIIKLSDGSCIVTKETDFLKELK